VTSAASEPTISIAMAIHNGVRFLEPQLRSIVDQSRRPDEIVVCDDGSTDGSAELCAAVLRSSGIRLILMRNEQPIGPYGSFSRALCATRGDFVCLCDQDDVWYRDKIAVTTMFLTSHPEVSAVVHDVDICRSDLSAVGQTKLERMTLLGLPHDGNVAGMSTVTRRSVIDAAFPLQDPSATAHDAWLHWVAAHLGERRVLDISLAAFRRHESNVTSDLLINRVDRVGRRPWLHWLRQLLRAGDADLRIERVRHRVALEIAWLKRARESHLVPEERIDASLTASRETLQALDEIEAISARTTLPRWIHATARHRMWRQHLGRLGPSIVVGALIYGTRAHDRRGS
jgi:glycosyltransferase involved in cell wall biosynthesis